MSALDLPADPERVAEAVDVLTEHLRSEPDDARAGEQLQRLAWRWAQQVTRDAQEAEQVYERALVHAGFTEPEAEPEPRAERAPERPPEPAPSDPELARRLEALAQRAADAEVRALTPVPKWDPEDQTVSGRIEVAAWADLRQRTGPVRVCTVRQGDGEAIEVWCSWQQLVALLGEAEAQRGRALAPGDLLSVQAHGKQRVGKSRSPSRMFTVAVEWAER